MRDAGLKLSDVDGLITCNAFAEPIMYHAEAVAEYLGWEPRHCVTVNTGGGTTFMALNMAAAAIGHGRYHRRGDGRQLAQLHDT